MVDFDLHKLGWRAFEDLCGVTAREILGHTVQVFANGQDAGRDGAFEGTAAIPVGATGAATIISGKVVIQCKFSEKVNKNITVSTIKSELSKLEKLVVDGRCDSYILMTNMTLTAENDIAISRAIKSAGVSQSVNLGREWFNTTISSNEKLRRFVPRVYGLGDVSQIFDERSREQSLAMLAELQPSLQKFVLTGTYNLAAKALAERRIIVLLGEPAVGKSLMAATLSLAALDEFRSTPYQVQSASELKKRWNANDSGRTFWVDDAFGATRIDEGLVADWQRNLVAVLTAVSQGNRVIITSRSHLYNQAVGLFKASTRRELQGKTVEIKVDDLTDDERSQMLYNHIKFGNQPKSYKRAVKPHLRKLSKLATLRPEIARRLGNSSFTTNLALDDVALADFVNRPHQFLVDTILELDPAGMAALALIYVSRGRLPSPIDSSMTVNHDFIFSTYGVNVQQVKNALQSIEGTFVQRRTEHRGAYWAFFHPTIGEAFESTVQDSSEALGVFLRGISERTAVDILDCSLGETAHSVTAVRAGSDYLAVPESLLTVALSALNLPSSRAAGGEFASHYSFYYKYVPFLLNRTSMSFLSKVIDCDVKLIGDLIADYASSSNDSAARLLNRVGGVRDLTSQEQDALASALRVRAREVADDAWAHDTGLASMLTSDQREALKSELLESLAEDVSQLPESFLENWISSEDPDAYFEELVVNLESLANIDFKSPENVFIIHETRQRLEQVIQQAREDYDREPDDYDKQDRYEGREEFAVDDSDRDMFDDVDA